MRSIPEALLISFRQVQAIDYPAILRLFYEEGYTSYICSEYEGSAFTDAFSSFERVEKHHAMCHRILAGLAKELQLSES